MIVYEHDGSIEGFLCALDQAAGAAGTEVGLGRRGESAAGDLFTHRVAVTAESASARAFMDRIRALSPEAPRRLLDVYMADGEDPGDAPIVYVRLLREQGRDVDGWLTHKAVARVLALSRRVRKECHAFKGLLRFRRLQGGLLWAPYRPDANITAALAPHFIQRNRGDAWLIHDVRRRLGALWDRRRLAWLTDDELPSGSDLDADEPRIAALWRGFHAAVAIPARINPALQRRNMPARYWEFLIETPGLGAESG